jgi:hypothetical protein
MTNCLYVRIQAFFLYDATNAIIQVGLIFYKPVTNRDNYLPGCDSDITVVSYFC